MKMTVCCSLKPAARPMFTTCLCNRLDTRMLQVLRKVEVSFMLVDDGSLLSITVVQPVPLKTHTGKWWISFTANMLLFATDLYGCLCNHDVVTRFKDHLRLNCIFSRYTALNIDVLLCRCPFTFFYFLIMVAYMSVRVLCVDVPLSGSSCNWRHCFHIAYDNI